MKRFCSDFSVINIHFQTIFSNKTLVTIIYLLGYLQQLYVDLHGHMMQW